MQHLIIMRLEICLQDRFLRKVVRIYLCYKYFIVCLHQVYFAVGEEKVLRTSFIRKMKGTIDHSVSIWVLVTCVRSRYRNLTDLYICDLCTFSYICHMSKSTLKIVYSVNSIIISRTHTFKHAHFLCSRITLFLLFWYSFILITL